MCATINQNANVKPNVTSYYVNLYNYCSISMFLSILLTRIHHVVSSQSRCKLHLRTYFLLALLPD